VPLSLLEGRRVADARSAGRSVVSRRGGRLRLRFGAGSYITAAATIGET